MRFLARFFAFAFALFAVLFAVTNHGELTLRLWPFPYVVTLPVYAAVLGSAALGFLVGLLAIWPALHRARRDFRREARALAGLEEEAARLRTRFGEADAPPRSGFRRFLSGDGDP